MPLYRGTDVLEVEPDRGGGTDDEVQRKVFILDSTTGIRSAEAADSAAASVREFSWLTFDRIEAAALRVWLDSRKGMAVPFWYPAWDEDLTLTADTGSGATLVVLDSGYAANVFSAGVARRHLAIRIPGGTLYYRKVSNAINNGDGTETVTLDEAVPVAMPAATLIGILHLVRLEQDMTTITWAGQFAEAKMQFRDLPTEVPL